MEEEKIVCLIKNALYIPAFLVALGFPEQMAWSVTMLAFLMFIDFITGVAASIKIGGLKSITSQRMTAGAVSKMMIILIPLVILVTGKGIGLDFMKYVQSGLAVLILSEAYSNLGNIQSYRTGVRIPEGDAISIFLAGIRKIISNFLEKSKLIEK